MIKITEKQSKEIDFLVQFFTKDFVPTPEEKEEYIAVTVLGKKQAKQRKFSSDKGKLFDAKRSLDIMIKMWREDLTVGLISTEELKEDFNTEYGHNLIDSIINSVDKEYRYKKLKQHGGTVLSYTNFPKVMETIRNGV